MKKWLLTLSILLAAGTSCEADVKRPIDVSQLPQTAQTLLTTHFADQKVILVIRETEGFEKGYDVVFENGDKIEFDRSGNWEEIDCNLSAVPTELIPANIQRFIATRHEGAAVMKISRDRRSTEVKLNNGWELEFDRNGNLIEVDRDTPYW